NVIGARLTEFHRGAGVALRLDARVCELLGRRHVTGVRLGDGEVVAADLVVLGVGAAPNTAWLAASGLPIDDGVVCDELLAAAPGVHAVGDVARWHHPLYRGTVRAEHWTAAIEHAEAVAATLTVRPTACRSVPYVWSDQHGVKIQIAGRVEPTDEVRF